MAATMTATPNPVLINQGQTSGTTTITWNGAEEGACRVFEVVGATEQLIAPLNGPGLVQGSVAVNINLGSHLYRLRPAAGGNTVAATLTVNVQVKSATGGGSILGTIEEGINQNTFIPVQAITRVTVTPQAEDSLFVFRTTVATIPVLTIRFDNPETGNILTTRFPFFGGPRTEHTIHVDRLPQDTKLFFKITAGNPLLSSSLPAVISGSFKTGRMDVGIVFDTIVVNSDSDKLSEGDLRFRFFAGDTETMEAFPGPTPIHEEGLSDGETAFIGQSIFVQKVPARIWIEVQCRDDDFFPIPYPGEGLGLIGTKPGGGPGSKYTSTDNYDYTHVRDEFDTLSSGTVQQGLVEVPFSMKTGNFPLAYEVFGRLQLTGTRGIGFRTDPAVPFNPNIGLMMATTASGKKTMMLVLGPDGEARLRMRSDERSGLLRDEWTSLGGHFLRTPRAVAVDESRFSLFGIDENGSVVYRTYAEGDSSSEEWTTLGGECFESVSATKGPGDSIELFGVDRDGNLHHRSLDRSGRSNGKREWNRIGGKIAGNVSAVYSPESGLALFALVRNGKVLHKHRTGKEWQPAGDKWASLAGRFEGILNASIQPDGSILLMVICTDRSVYKMEIRDYPRGASTAEWESPGSLDSIVESHSQETPIAQRALPSRDSKARSKRSASA